MDNNRFSLHYDGSSQTGSYYSPIHMNREEATIVFTKYLLSCCLICRLDDSKVDRDDFLKEISNEIHGDFEYIIMNTVNFPNYMKFFGAIWWYLQFFWYMNRMEKDGKEGYPVLSVPLFSSIVLKCGNNLEYCILSNPAFYSKTTHDSNPSPLVELEQKYSLVSLLIEGYMWAQSCENLVSEIYRKTKDYDQTYHYLRDRAQIEFGLTDNDILVYSIP